MSYTVLNIAADRSILSLTSDPTQFVVLATRKSSATNYERAGQIRHFAGGYTQAALYDQDDTTVPITLAHLSEYDAYRVRQWRGQVVCLRTTEGARHFGVYFAVANSRVMRTTPEDLSGTNTYDLDITLQRVSFTEST